MAILDNINAIPVSPDDLSQVMRLYAQSPQASSDARMLGVLGYVQELGMEDAAGMALALGWRLEALEAFLASPEGGAWRGTDFGIANAGGGIIMHCAAIERLIELDRRPRFDHHAFADHLLHAANGR
ncbi:MAG TPA: hypothetical protein VF509_11915 [Sphingobium sp.]